MSSDTNNSKKFRISIGEGSLGKVKNKSVSWGDLKKRLAEPVRDNAHTLKAYLALPKERQDELKNVGFLVGGWCNNGHRLAANIEERHVMILDVDSATKEQLIDIELGYHGLSGYEYYIYSTRKHTAEKPRLRVVVPLSKPVSADKYVPLSRILAEKFDETMESVDPVTFRIAQLMYWPSVCKGADFFTDEGRGKFLDPDETLEAFGDWHDFTKLPRSPRDDQRESDPNRKAENPTEKKGLIGAFCRAYDVPAAIETFLSDVYVPGDTDSEKPRYTYLGGSTTNGAIVEDDGLFLYSFHGTDPVSTRLVNSFDLVRIHLFNDQDAKSPENTSQTRLPSYKAMEELLADDKSVAMERREANYDFGAMDEDLFGEDEDELTPKSLLEKTEDEVEAEKKDDEKVNWQDDLEITREGDIKSNLPNMALILRHDKRFRDVTCWNEFQRKIVSMSPIRSKAPGVHRKRILDPINGTPWEDVDDLSVRYILEMPRGKKKPGYGMKASDRDVVGAVHIVGHDRKFHPVKRYLESLKWDGTYRMSKLFVDYLGSPDDSYHREIARIFLLAAVTRIYEPGHKFDYVPIIEGAQGQRKSTFISVIGKYWFKEFHADYEKVEKVVEATSGMWIGEMPELSKFKRTENEAIKAFFSGSTETTRLAFGKRAADYPRMFVFIGSTNKKEYLRDETGGRRFWPVECHVVEINIDKLKKNIDQIWAEVYAAYKTMREKQPHGLLPLYLSDKSAADIAKDMQESRREISYEEQLAAQIESWLDEPVTREDATGGRVDDGFDADSPRSLRQSTCLQEIYEKMLDKDLRQYNRVTALELGRAMAMVPGWLKGGAARHGKYGVQKVYLRAGQEQTKPNEEQHPFFDL